MSLINCSVTECVAVGNGNNGLDMVKTVANIEPRIPIPASPVPIATPTAVGVYTITKSGSYYLQGDRLCSGTGIQVEADNVTIDLCGFSLAGPDTGTNYGVYMDERSNVEIRNGTVRDFLYGIYGIGNGRGNKVIDVRAVSNITCGVFINNESTLIKECTAVGNGSAFNGSASGITVGSNCIVIDNLVNRNGLSATVNVRGIDAGMGCVVSGNTVYLNGYRATNVWGISASTGCTVTNNTVSANGNSASGTVNGINSGTGCTVKDNVSYENGDSAAGDVTGIYANQGNTLIGNTAYKNGDNALGVVNIYGIRVGRGSTVIGNTAFENGSSALEGNVVGIKLESNSFVDQNTAYGNGSPADTKKNMSSCATCTFGINHAPYSF